MSAQHGTMPRLSMSQNAVSRDAVSPNALAHEREAMPGLGSGALTRAVERWRRALLHDQALPAAGPSGSPAGAPASAPAAAGASVAPGGDPEALAALARRLDDSGCSYGRVSAARLDSVTRAYDRLETKMNAVLMAVTGTFLSTLAGLLLYYVRGAGQ